MKPDNHSSVGILVIVDGWGMGRNDKMNPIAIAETPFFDSIGGGLAAGSGPSAALKKTTRDCHFLAEQIAGGGHSANFVKLTAVGPEVGMPPGAKGSTAVGHEVMSGVNYIHPMLRISNEIDKGCLRNKVIENALKKTALNHSTLHLMGLVSTNNEHSCMTHLDAILRTAVRLGVKKIYIHFFSDGRGTPPFSAVSFAEYVEENVAIISAGEADIKIATVGGRDITMNRSIDSWQKSIITYRAIIEGRAKHCESIFSALKEDYEKGITDQYISIRVLGDYSGVSDNDTLIHFNFRKDRAEMLMKVMLESEEDLKKITGNNEFKKLKYRNDLNYKTLNFVALVQYYRDIPCEVAYPDIKQEYSLGRLLEEFGYTQYRISGVDKKHAVRLLSGGSREKPFPHEKRIVVDLPEEMKKYKLQYDEKKGEEGYKLDPYEKYPLIELPELTDKIIEVLNNSSGKTFIIANISNPDMVGHTANMDASVKAAEAVDRSLEKIYNAAAKKLVKLFITADHGNLEVIETEDATPSSFHTDNPVPFAVLGNKNITLKNGGTLKDVAPTVLYIMEPSKKDEILKRLKGEILVE